MNKLLEIPDFGVLVLMVLGKWTAITAIKAAICLTGHAPPGVGNDPLVDLACQLGKALLGKLIGSKLPKYGGGLGGKALQIAQGKVTGGALDLASGQVCPPSGC
ncbi:MAG: hypothetical protein IPM35_16010 [Myxococcales bacterium]|nr:hypothetical protein [Myxococcales bacterium]